MTKEKPILFSTEMVQAILEGRKTQTRRVIKPQPEWKDRKGLCSQGWSWSDKNTKLSSYPEADSFSEAISLCCPYGNVGDILWVRETWQETTWMTKEDENYGFIYRASENGKDWEDNTEDWKWKPSIFMPKEACRIKLRIVNVRVERLQDISEEDAIKEGVESFYSENLGKKLFKEYGYKNSYTGFPDISFKSLWDSINYDKFPWHKNPWIWVLEFERLGSC